MKILINEKVFFIKEYNSFLKKLIGLSFKKNPINYGIILKRCNSIHTFFMKQNIDVCITNKNYKIIYLQENVKPNQVILPIKNGYYTLELPLNTIKNLKLNDTLRRA